MKSAISSLVSSKAFTAVAVTTLTATSTFLIWYNIVKTTFDNVAEIASNTDFAISIVENEDGKYSLGFKESSEDEAENQDENTNVAILTNVTDATNTISGEQNAEQITYKTKDEVIDAIAKKLKEDGIDAKDMHLDAKSGYIQKFIEAEITTNYPNLSHEYGKVNEQNSGGNIISGIFENDEMKYLQGIVNIIRRDVDAEEDDLGQYLEYIPYGDENTAGTFKHMVSNTNQNVFKYFSINESDWSIKVATYRKVSGDNENSYTISEQSIPYKSIVAKYSVPFEFLVALAEVSDNPGWAEKVAEMVLENSKIDLVIQDCLTITKEEVTYTYDERREAYVGEQKVVDETIPHSTTSVTTTELNTVTSYIREVDTWIVNVKQDYVKNEQGPIEGAPSVEELENSDYSTAEIPSPVSEGNLATLNSHKENRKNTTVLTTTTTKYDKGTTVNENDDGSSSDSLDHYLMIGDSDMLKLKESGAFQGATYYAESTATAQYWLDNFDSLPDAEQVNGVCVLLGKNSIAEEDNGVSAMKILIDKLDEKYEGKEIYIQRVLPVSKDATWSESVTNNDTNNIENINSIINSYNSKIKTYCGQKLIEYIDTSKDLIDSDGYLKTIDYSILADNIKKSIKDTRAANETTGVITSNEKKFLGLWKNKKGKYIEYYNVDGTYNADALYDPDGVLVKYKEPNAFLATKAPAPIIVSNAEVLFELLASSERTQQEEQLMRYLLYIYTGTDYGVTEFDFSVFDISSFNSASGGGNWEKLIKYLHYFECGGSATTNADGTKYIVEDDGAGHPTVGYGVDIYNCGHTDEFRAAGYDLSMGSEIDVEFVDAIEKKEIENKKEAVEAVVSGLNLKEYQIHALITRAYNCGSAGAVGTRNGKTFVEAYTEYWKETDDEYKVPPNDTMFTHALYTNYMNKPITSEGQVLNGLVRRRKSEWILFKTGYYGYETEGQVDQYWEEGGGDITQYYQTDYAHVPYGSGSIASCGCGPTCFAMIATALTGTEITPPDAVAWCGNSYYVSGAGTSWAYFAAAANHFGMNGVQDTSSIDQVITALQDGKYVISSQSAGLFTKGGHFIVLSGIDDQGNISVKDPNKNNAVNKGYNERTFTKEEINQAAQNYWIFN